LIGGKKRSTSRINFSQLRRAFWLRRKFAGQVHDRGPVFLQPEHFAAWLDGSAGLELLKPASEELLEVWPVSKRVNRPALMSASLVEPVDVTNF
jgi:putative SOS response-associated peptidase YedK